MIWGFRRAPGIESLFAVFFFKSLLFSTAMPDCGCRFAPCQSRAVYCLILILYISPADWLRGLIRVDSFLPPGREAASGRLHLLKEEVPVFPGCQWFLYGDLWA